MFFLEVDRLLILGKRTGSKEERSFNNHQYLPHRLILIHNNSVLSLRIG